MHLVDINAAILDLQIALCRVCNEVGRKSPRYIFFSLRLGILLVLRFMKTRKEADSQDYLIEAKEIELVIRRRNWLIGPSDREHWDIYRGFLCLADAIVKVEKAGAQMKSPQSPGPPPSQNTSTPLAPFASGSADGHHIHSRSKTDDEAVTQHNIPATACNTSSAEGEAASAEGLVDPAAPRHSTLPIRPSSPAPQTPSMLDTSESARYTLQCLHSDPERMDFETYAGWCWILAECHLSRFHRRFMEHSPDIEEAFEYQSTSFHLYFDAVDTSLHHPDLVPQTTSILTKYLLTHGFMDMTVSVLLRLDSLELLEILIRLRAPLLESPISLHVWNFFLGRAYYNHFLSAKILRFVDSAISYFVASELDSTSDLTLRSCPMQIYGRARLADLYQLRYSLLQDSHDLDSAIKNLEQLQEPVLGVAIQSLPTRLGHLHWLRFSRHSRSREDKEKAKYYFCMEDSSLVPPGLASLEFSESLLQCYHQDRESAYLDRAIELLEAPHDGCDDPEPPPTAAASSQLCVNTYLALAEAYRQRDAEGDPERILECFKRSGQEGSTIPDSLPIAGSMRKRWKIGALAHHKYPLSRYISAVQWGKLALERELPECIEAFQLVASLIPDVVWLGNTLDDKHRVVGEFTFGEAACVAALKFARPNLAVEFLEQSLSITVRQILQLRQEVPPELRMKYPNLAERMAELLEKVRSISESGDGAKGKNPVDASGVPIRKDSHEMVMEYKELIHNIRSKPGFEDTLRPLKYSQLAAAARFGPVIMIEHDSEVTDETHALIILNSSAEEPVDVMLPEATKKTLSFLWQKFSRILGRFKLIHRGSTVESLDEERGGRPSPHLGMSKEQEFDVFLHEIWEKIVQPIYNALAKNDIMSGRIWWCPSGIFTMFPLHAAAPIDSPYISSYTHGLEALIKAQSRSMAISDEGNQSLELSVIGMQNDPVSPYLSLPSVRREVGILNESVASVPGLSVRELIDDEACVESVMSCIESSQIVHLACHGSQDLRQPLNSRLSLWDGELKLRTILKEELKFAEFAFLSACQTASGELMLANESVHLAGGFMAAGFRGVVGTLWSISDEDAPRVTKGVYEAMVVDGRFHVEKAAEGLNRAVKKMRKDGIPAHRWVPFIHVGI